jgi:PAS domain S-box-containing protein
MARKKSTTEDKPVSTSQTDWDSVFRILHEPAMIVSPDFNILFANQFTNEAFGLTEQELKSRHCYEIFHGTNAPVPGCPLAKSISSGRAEAADVEVEILHSSYRVSCTPILDENGKIQSIIHLATDITERKRTEDSLRESQELLSLFMRHSPIYAFIKEVTPGESRVLQASDNYEEMIGIPSREMIGKTMSELFLPESAAKFTADDWAVVSNGQVLKLDEDLNGRHYTTIKFPIIQGNKTLLAGYTIDITERVQAEENIQKIAKHYQALIEKAPDGIVLLNEQGNFKFFSPSAKKMFGYDVSEELTGNPVEYTHPDDLPRVLPELARLLEDPSYVPTLQYRFIDKSGNWKWVESTFSNLLADPSVESIVINFRDVSERKQAEEELTNSEMRYRRLFEAARDGILILDAESGVITDVNPFLVEMLGFSKEEICGKELWELGFFKDIAASKANFLELQEKEYIRYEDLPLETVNGRKFRVEFISNVYRVNHHKVVQCNIRDITERKQAEKNLLQSEQTLRNFIINSPDTIYVLDLENHTNKYLNCMEFCGYPKSVLESRASIMFALHPQDIPIVQEDWKKMLRASDGEVTSCEYRLQRKDGFWEWIQQRMTILSRTVDGAPSQVLVTLSIITERKQIEEKIHQLNIDLEQRVEERTHELREAQEQLVRHEKLAVLGQMASSVGHELRNPLSVITSAVYYLNLVQPDADAKITEYLGIIDQEVRNSDKIITDLLDFSRIKSVDREVVSVSDLVHQTLERFPAPANVEVTLDIPTDLPRAYVDVRQMIQVLGNLTVNACQAMKDGGQLTILSRVEKTVDEGQPTEDGKPSSVLGAPFIVISVKDTGVGITPENMKKLFEPLFTTKTKGIGLGLAVSQKLTEANGGRIEVESEAGVGSIFTVWLPTN